MATTFGRIAYETLDVCNGVEMETVEAAFARTNLSFGATAVDIGTGNAAVALRLAERFGLSVTAIEFDPVMAELARERIAASPAGTRVTLVEGPAHAAFAAIEPVDMVVALGTTNLTGEGRPTPRAGFDFLHRHIRPRGWLLWGDIVWLGEPTEPLRQIVEATNRYADDAGWRSAAAEAGFDLEWSEISNQAVFDAYERDTLAAAIRWLAAHPDAEEAGAVRFNADRMKTIFQFGRGVIGFGLYLLRR
jgi:predicted O-methyltransferase YrrM